MFFIPLVFLGRNLTAVSASLEAMSIVIGHVPSEQGGMEECTRWLKGFVKKAPVEFVATKEPFWTVSEKN